jgi:hypothetical protein
MNHRVLSATGLAALLALSATAVALAIEPSVRLGITPVGHEGTYFDLTMRGGERRVLSVELANFGADPVEARTYAADVYTIVNGGLGAELHHELPSGTTRWLDYPTELMQLPPGRAVVRDLVVEVPSDVEPGEYIASLVIENAEPIGATGSLTINQVNRTAIAVAIMVPGPRRPALEIGGVRHELVNGVSVVSFAVANSGNVHLKPEGRFVLEADNGRLVSQAPVEMGTFFSRTGTTVEVPLAEALQPGEYCALLSLRDAEERVAEATDCLPFRVEAAVADASPPQASAPGGAAVDQRRPPNFFGWLAGWLPVAGAALLAVTVLAGGAALALRPRGRARGRALR